MYLLKTFARISREGRLPEPPTENAASPQAARRNILSYEDITTKASAVQSDKTQKTTKNNDFEEIHLINNFLTKNYLAVRLKKPYNKMG